MTGFASQSCTECTVQCNKGAHAGRAIAVSCILVEAGIMMRLHSCAWHEVQCIPEQISSGQLALLSNGVAVSTSCAGTHVYRRPQGPAVTSACVAWPCNERIVRHQAGNRRQSRLNTATAA